MRKKLYKIKGMDCPSCAMVIETELEDLGVKANCSYQKETLAVEYDPELVPEENILEEVKNEGYNISPQD